MRFNPYRHNIMQACGGKSKLCEKAIYMAAQLKERRGSLEHILFANRPLFCILPAEYMDMLASIGFFCFDLVFSFK